MKLFDHQTDAIRYAMLNRQGGKSFYQQASRMHRVGTKPPKDNPHSVLAHIRDVAGSFDRAKEEPVACTWIVRYRRRGLRQSYIFKVWTWHCRMEPVAREFPTREAARTELAKRLIQYHG